MNRYSEKSPLAYLSGYGKPNPVASSPPHDAAGPAHTPSGYVCTEGNIRTSWLRSVARQTDPVASSGRHR